MTTNIPLRIILLTKLKTGFLQYGFALAAIIAAVMVRLFLAPLLHDRWQFISLVAAIYAFGCMASGWRPTVLALASGSVGLIYFIVEPQSSLYISGSEDVYGIFLFVGIIAWTNYGRNICETLDGLPTQTPLMYAAHIKNCYESPISAKRRRI